MTVDQLQYVHGIRTVKSPICNKIYPPPFFPKSDLPNNFKINIVERVKIDTPNTRIVIHESLEHSFNKSSDILHCDSKIFRRTKKKMKNKKYYNVQSEQFKKLIKKIRGKIHSLNTHIGTLYMTTRHTSKMLTVTYDIISLTAILKHDFHNKSLICSK